MKNLFETPYIEVVKFPADVLTTVFESNENSATDGDNPGETEDW